MAKASRTTAKRSGRRPLDVHVATIPQSSPLLRGVDNGAPIVVTPEPYIGRQRDPGWGAFLDSFLARNRLALQALNLEPRVVPGRDGVRLELQPGLRAGAIPLTSPLNGRVTGGVVISPRFGWSGVGRVLSATGWGSGPEFLNLPLVPGSGREVPPWVLAGPVLHRLTELLRNLRPGYRERCEVRTHPRGQIQWNSYLTNQFSTGRWHHVPCKYSELDTDSRLRQTIRWTLERLRIDLSASGGSDSIALSLISKIVSLLEQVFDVPSRRPSRGELDQRLNDGSIASHALREGLRAIAWVADERGLGGGQTSDGLAWMLPLEVLWERFVESTLRDEAAVTGGCVRVGRTGETTVPLSWNEPSHRALGHLVPDFVVYRPGNIEIVDAKYKAHFADLDSTRWAAFTDEAKESFRADLHQILAYAAVVGATQPITTTLLYPVPQRLFEELRTRGRDRVSASIPVASQMLQITMRALPFGRAL